MFKFEFYIYKEITYEHIENKETGSKNTGESFRNHYKNINKFIFCTCLFDLGFCGTCYYEKRLYLFLLHLPHFNLSLIFSSYFLKIQCFLVILMISKQGAKKILILFVSHELTFLEFSCFCHISVVNNLF